MTRPSLLILLTSLLLGCERSNDGQRLVLEWKDTEQNVTFQVTETPSALTKHNSTLHVQREGRNQTEMIDDDAIFSTITFVRHDHWLLVVCRGLDEVWAGYDYETRQLYGESDWNKLPFTHWSGQGSVVAKRKIRDHGASPANFPRSPSNQKQ